MRRTLHRWWQRLAHRRAAARRGSDLGRYGFDPHYRHSAFGKPRFGQFDTRVPWRLWTRRILLTALALAAGWVLWQSWIGLRIFDN